MIFLLKKEAHSKLVLWNDWKRGDMKQMIVPYIEAGYPREIELSFIDELVFVTKGTARDIL